MTPDWQPTLSGALVTARPFTPADVDALYAVASDPRIWEQHPEPTRWQREVFQRFVDSGLALAGTTHGGMLVVHDAVSGALIGSSRWYEWNAEAREVAIGYTFLARSHWGGRWNGELKRLMLAHSFQWAERVWFHVGVDNTRSQRALERIGAQFHSRAASPADPAREAMYFTVDRSGFAL